MICRRGRGAKSHPGQAVQEHWQAVGEPRGRAARQSPPAAPPSCTTCTGRLLLARLSQGPTLVHGSVLLWQWSKISRGSHGLETASDKPAGARGW